MWTINFELLKELRDVIALAIQNDEESVVFRGKEYKREHLETLVEFFGELIIRK